MGGTAQSLITEVLLDVPGTAHVLGGCPMGRSAEDGVEGHSDPEHGRHGIGGAHGGASDSGGRGP